MKFLALGLVLATAFAGVASAQTYGDYGPPAAGPGVSVGFSVFYNSLSPYGRWITLSPWGQVWTPSGVPAGWRPYTDGHWVYTNDGWTWVSNFAWGWAPFHYGRWDLDASYGWVWIPADVWGPAWVAWRWGDGFVGWAPLPPGVGWQLGLGFTVANFDYLIPHRDWIFCGDRDFDQPYLRGFLFPDRDNDRFIRRTRNVTDFASVGDRIVNRSIRPGWIAQATGRTVPRFRLLERGRPGRALESRRAHEVQIFRPRFATRGERRPMENRGFQRGQVGRRGRSSGEMYLFNQFARSLFQPQQRQFRNRELQHRQFQQQSQHRQFDHQQLQRRQFQQRQPAGHGRLAGRQRQAHMQFRQRSPRAFQYPQRAMGHRQMQQRFASQRRRMPRQQHAALQHRAAGHRSARGPRAAARGGPHRR